MSPAPGTHVDQGRGNTITAQFRPEHAAARCGEWGRNLRKLDRIVRDLQRRRAYEPPPCCVVAADRTASVRGAGNAISVLGFLLTL
jgi:hypothetical protein